MEGIAVTVAHCATFRASPGSTQGITTHKLTLPAPAKLSLSKLQSMQGSAEVMARATSHLSLPMSSLLIHPPGLAYDCCWPCAPRPPTPQP
jgi:hypothetical protein